MRTQFFLLCLMGALALAGCDSDGGSDGGTGMDASGSDAGPGGDTDAGPGGDTDAGPGGDTDAGPGGDTDAGPGGTDAGPGDPNACTATSPCTGGRICTGGPTCGDPWMCIDSTIPCTDDAVEYCGCDGMTFRDSSTCPTRPFERMGPCAPADGFNCDRSTVTCRAPEPMCPAGEVAEVMGACWTFRCVPIDECGCSGRRMCPTGSACDDTTGRCRPR